GVAKRGRIGQVGLKGIDVESLLKDVIFNNLEFDNEEILEHSLPKLKSKGTYIPIHKYISSSKKIDTAFLKKSGLYKLYERDKKFYKDKVATNYQNTFNQRRYTRISQIIDSVDYKIGGKFELLSLYILKNNTSENLKTLEIFIKENFEKNKANSNFKKLVCIFDLLKYKGTKTPH
ncbi:hypothetical protein D9K79_15375, partial [Acinetobacter cumulans]